MGKLRRGRFMQINIGSGIGLQLLIAADMIDMDVGINDMGNFHALGTGDIRYSCTSRLGSTTTMALAKGQPMT
jgi:hypothetical protein